MNPLRLAILQLGLDEHLAMMELRDKAIISDNAIHPEDVATADAKRAIEWLRTNHDDNTP